MTWKLPRYRTGDVVEVRRKEEIFATLDEHGAVDGMPFMPEMLQYGGRRFRVGAVAHKTYDSSSSKRLSLKAGEWVEVRSQEESLATLDEHGHLENLPFMPEMLQYCG